MNAYRCPAGSEGDATQRLTFATMDKARRAYEALYAQPSAQGGGGTVTTVAAVYPEDMDFARQFFAQVEPIQHSSIDVGQFKIPRKLPLLFEVLAAGRRKAGPDDYLVFTNSDICLLLGFYDTIASVIGLGYDAVIVNRRTVEAFPPDPALAPIMATSLGENHPGFDCFVFRAGLFDEFLLGTAIIGRGWVMRPLIYNMVAKAKRMLMLKAVHLTYHLGDDRAWSGSENEDYYTHNLMEAYKLLAQSSGAERERLKEFCRTHPEMFGHEVEFPAQVAAGDMAR